MSLQHIALMRRLSLERLSLLAYIVKGDDLLALRKSFAEQDLEKLQKIKSTMTWIDEQIDAFIAAMEFDPEEAPFWILYYSTSTVIADEEDGYSDEEMNSLLRGAMREYVDNNTYIRDYIIAAKALVLNWEIQLKAHIAAGE